MARKKDLAGLASLAGLAYMASREKAAKGDVPSGDDQYNPDVKQRGPDLGAIYAEDGSLSKLRRNTETGDLYSPDEPITRPSAAASPASQRASTKPSSSAMARPSITGDDQYNPDVKLRGAAPTSRVGRAGQAQVSGESLADSIAREAVAKRKAREAGGEKRTSSLAMPDSYYDERMKKGGAVKGWGAARGARKAKIY